MSRADTPKEARFPFYLYLDEFPTFTGVASDSYQKILARSRNTISASSSAMQQTHQIPDKLLKEMFRQGVEPSLCSMCHMTTRQTP